MEEIASAQMADICSGMTGAVDLETGMFQIYHENASFVSLKLLSPAPSLFFHLQHLTPDGAT